MNKDLPTHKAVEEFILSLPHSKLDYPFGEDVAVYMVFVSLSTRVDGALGAGEQRSEAYRKYGERVAEPATQRSATSAGRVSGFARKQASMARGEWKMYALIQEKKSPIQLSLKCEPKLAEVLRAKYDSVMPGYHLNKKHWNTILLVGEVPWDEVKDLIRHSYELVK